MAIEKEKLVALYARVSASRATWHDFTEAFGAGSEHDPAVLGLRAYGDDMNAAEEFLASLFGRYSYSVGRNSDGKAVAIVCNSENVELARAERTGQTARTLLLATLSAIVKAAWEETTTTPERENT